MSVFFTARIGAWAVRHRWLVLSAGLLVFVGSIAVLVGVGANTDVEGGGKGDFGKALALQEERFGTVARAPTELVIFEHPTLTVVDRSYQDTVVGLMSGLRRLRAERTTTAGQTNVTTSTRVVASTLTHYDIGAPATPRHSSRYERDRGTSPSRASRSRESSMPPAHRLRPPPSRRSTRSLTPSPSGRPSTRSSGSSSAATPRRRSR
jgi:hypothetical protein